jgi:large subunit ribosomal protein L43
MALSSRPSVFLPQIAKVVFEYSDLGLSSYNTRSYILAHLTRLARDNPHVEFVVRNRLERQPIARGIYGTPPRFSSVPSC